MTETVRDEDWVGGSAIIRDPTGLHARPAVKLTKLAKTFLSAIEIRADNGTVWTNAKSPTAVMKLRAGPGLPLHIRAAGEDARAAVDALVALVDKDFND
jgi:phosphocarrier protein HPr